MGPLMLQRLAVAFVAAMAPLVMKLLAWTWSFRRVNRRVYEEYIASGRPVVAAIWHRLVVPGAVLFGPLRPFLMVSLSRDGDLTAAIVRRLGFRCVRGSSSRGGKEALAELTDRIASGGRGAITVDGPKGPAGEPKIGIVVASRDAGAPIVPIAAHVRRAFRVRSWDRTIIPLPFARIVLSFGDPLWVPREADRDECERWRVRVREALGRSEEAARAR